MSRLLLREQKMQNGELRTRLTSSTDQSGYVRTEASEKGGWQASHFHRWLKETYVVQLGWMALAELNNEQLTITKLSAGDVATVVPPIAHNVYLPSGAVVHTVKHGSAPGPDWNPFPDLDALTIQLTESEIHHLSSGFNSGGESTAER